MECPEPWPCKEIHWLSRHPAEHKAPSLGSAMWSWKNVGLLHKTERGSGKLGGRPQLTGMGLDKPGEPQTRYFS